MYFRASIFVYFGHLVRLGILPSAFEKLPLRLDDNVENIVIS